MDVAVWHKIMPQAFVQQKNCRVALVCRNIEFEVNRVRDSGQRGGRWGVAAYPLNILKTMMKQKAIGEERFFICKYWLRKYWICHGIFVRNQTRYALQFRSSLTRIQPIPRSNNLVHFPLYDKRTLFPKGNVLEKH